MSAPATPAAVPRRIDWASLPARLGPVMGLVFVVALFALLRPATFLTTDNFQIMLLQTAVVGTAALGMTLIIISGGIDLSIGSNIALCTVAIALLLQHQVPPTLAALGGIATGAACGALIGLLVTRLHLTPFIVTLGMWGALRGAAKGLAGETMVSAPATWLNDLLQSLGPKNRWMIFPPGVWLMIALTLLVAALLRYTRFGRHIFAIGSNEQTARLCGVSLRRTKLLIYTVGLAFAGVAGVLQFSYLTVGDPTTAAGLELAVIAAVVIGGASLNGGEGSVFGSLMGALIMTVVANGCTKMNLANWVQEIVTGAIIIAAVVLDRLRHRGVG
ncbi:MAG: ribose transport system permease protein [Chthoniobacter sp.]|jgi:ribose/xylose/arabinose/galactoside ABC-type transport system permease subunit|nr:ribose transport system permease protein [Chthoniobacter sp.]